MCGVFVRDGGWLDLRELILEQVSGNNGIKLAVKVTYGVHNADRGTDVGHDVAGNMTQRAT